MIAEIITQLKTGAISNVIPFGSATPSTTPYVVVKPETYTKGRGLRIILHYKQGANMYVSGGVTYTPMDDYIYNVLPGLLSEWTMTNNHGESITVHDTGEITVITAVSDDNTVAMERLFYISMLPY